MMIIKLDMLAEKGIYIAWLVLQSLSSTMW